MKKRGKQLAALLLALCLLAALPLSAGAEASFEALDLPGDVPPPMTNAGGNLSVPQKIREAMGPAAWYSNAVYDLWYLGGQEGQPVLSGTGEVGLVEGLGYARLFRPKQAVTREQFVVMLARLAQNIQGEDFDPYPDGGLDEGDFVDGTRTDVSRFAWAQMDWAAQAGILVGDGQRYRGTDPLTRQEMAALLQRFADYMGLEVAGDQGLPEDFLDLDQIAPWARSGMLWAYQKGLIAGTAKPASSREVFPGRLFSPTATATRAEAAQVLWWYARRSRWLTDSPWGAVLFDHEGGLS